MGTKKTGPKGRELLRHLTGISTPVAGKDWEPPVDERSKARQLLVYLADQQVLSESYDREIAPFVARSVIAIRDRLALELKDVPHSPLRDGLRAARAACCKFLDENQSARSGYGPPYEGQLHSTLGALRTLFGIHVARIACAYDLEVDTRLESILPPIVEDEPGAGIGTVSDSTDES